MENNEEIVLTEGTEKVEQPTEEVVETVETTVEEPVKKYTDAEVDEIVSKRLGRYEAKLKKQNDKKYGELESILKAGLKVDSLEEATEGLKKFYEERGIDIPNEPRYSDYDETILANAEVEEMKGMYSLEELEEEANKIASVGIENMSGREKKVLLGIDTYIKAEKSKKELASLGIKEEALEDKDFIEFANNLNPNLSQADKYKIYTKYRPKPEVEPIGSMKGVVGKDNAVKDFYTREEALQFTKEDFDKNPELFKAVEKSMQKW